MRDCCDDWAENASDIDSVLHLHQARLNVNLDIEPFRYCPWCSVDRRKPEPLNIPSHLEEEGDHPGGTFEEKDGRLVWESDEGPPRDRAAHAMAAKKTIQEVLIQGWTVETKPDKLIVKPRP